MKIELTQGRAGVKVSYQVGEVIDKPKKEALNMIENGKAKPVKSENVETQSAPKAEEDQSNEYPKHKGGGWYELSNGETVKKKSKAVKKERKL